MSAELPELQRFVCGQIAAADFSHREHVRMAFQMLQQHDFAETVLYFSQALRAMARQAGRPESFNQTITIAFLALIAQRMACTAGGDFVTFAAANPDLFDKALLARWYRPEQLTTALARRSFLLPDPAP
jgi:hypothetical protein